MVFSLSISPLGWVFSLSRFLVLCEGCFTFQPVFSSFLPVPLCPIFSFPHEVFPPSTLLQTAGMRKAFPFSGFCLRSCVLTFCLPFVSSLRLSGLHCVGLLAWSAGFTYFILVCFPPPPAIQFGYPLFFHLLTLDFPPPCQLMLNLDLILVGYQRL